MVNRDTHLLCYGFARQLVPFSLKLLHRLGQRTSSLPLSAVLGRFPIASSSPALQLHLAKQVLDLIAV